jgi:hypothetical protein
MPCSASSAAPATADVKDFEVMVIPQDQTELFQIRSLTGSQSLPKEGSEFHLIQFRVT